jgi:hypothetical protein
MSYRRNACCARQRKIKGEDAEQVWISSLANGTMPQSGGLYSWICDSGKWIPTYQAIIHCEGKLRLTWFDSVMHS